LNQLSEFRQTWCAHHAIGDYPTCVLFIYLPSKRQHGGRVNLWGGSDSRIT